MSDLDRERQGRKQPLAVRADDTAVSFAVHVTPRSSRNAILGIREGALRVALTAPPVEGEANAALVELIAKALSVSKRTVTVMRGDRSRRKTVRVEDVGAEQVRRLVDP